MALQPCRECGREVSTEAATCPNCGVADPTGTVAASAAAAAETKAKEARKGSLGCLLIAVFFGACFYLLGRDSSSPSNVEPTASLTAADSAVIAHGYADEECERVVRDRLLSPTTAEFADSEFRVMEPAPGQRAFVVRGQATAQNPAGVPITHRYVCMVLPEGGRVQAFLRSSEREMYNEIVRMAGFDS